MRYICDYGLVHHKPTTGEPSSNNGFIYSALYLNRGGSLDMQRISDTYINCIERLNKDGIMINRLPHKQEPPISMDEIIGMVSMGLLSGYELDRNDWYFHGNKDVYKEISFFRVLKGLWKVKGQHRNYFWQNRIIPVYKVAFRVPAFHRYYIKKVSDMKPTLWEKISFYLHLNHTLMYGTDGVKNMVNLELSDMNKESVNKYFREDHIIQDLL